MLAELKDGHIHYRINGGAKCMHTILRDTLEIVIHIEVRSIIVPQEL